MTYYQHRAWSWPPHRYKLRFDGYVSNKPSMRRSRSEPECPIAAKIQPRRIPPRMPPSVEDVEEEWRNVEDVEDVAAIEGWRRMMMRLHRLFFKRRCLALLEAHLWSYRCAIEGWRRMMMLLHRLWFKQRCLDWLEEHLRSYRGLRLQGPD